MVKGNSNGSKDPSILTKERLKLELISNGVTLPESDERKDVYVRLYRQHIIKRQGSSESSNKLLKGKSEFSSDDDTENTPKSRKKRQSTSKRRSVAREREKLPSIDMLSDAELTKHLKKYEPDIGPVLNSTRDVYRKKLKNHIAEKANATNGGEFSDRDDIPKEKMNVEGIKKGISPRKRRGKDSRSSSRKEVNQAENKETVPISDEKKEETDTISATAQITQQNEIKNEEEVHEANLWYFIIVLLIGLAVYVGALIQKSSPRI